MTQELTITKSRAHILSANELQNGMVILVDGSAKEVYNVNQYGRSLEVEFIDIENARINNILIDKREKFELIHQQKNHFKPMKVHHLTPGMKVKGIEEDLVVVDEITIHKNYYLVRYHHPLLSHKETIKLEKQGYLYVKTKEVVGSIDTSQYPLADKYIEISVMSSNNLSWEQKFGQLLMHPAFMGLWFGLLYLVFLLIVAVFAGLGFLLELAFGFSLQYEGTELFWLLQILVQLPIFLANAGNVMFTYCVHVLADLAIEVTPTSTSIGILSINVLIVMAFLVSLEVILYIRNFVKRHLSN